MDMVTAYITAHSKGKKKPICGSAIASALGVSGIEVRRLVNAARCNGDPICSNGNGYYIAHDKDELLSTIESLDGRIAGMMNARNGLKRCLQTM